MGGESYHLLLIFIKQKQKKIWKYQFTVQLHMAVCVFKWVCEFQ